MKARILDVLAAAVCLAAAFFFLYVINRALTAPIAEEVPVAPSPSLGTTWDSGSGLVSASSRLLFQPVAEVAPEEAPAEPKAGPFFISAAMLHQACADKQPHCVVYIYGVLDMLMHSMDCELAMQASKETGQGVLSSLGRLHSELSDMEMNTWPAARTVAMAFVTTPAYGICKAQADAPRASL